MKRLAQIFQVLLGAVALILTALVATGRLAWRTIRNLWTNRSKRLRRWVLTIVAICVAGYVVCWALVVYDYNYGRYERYDESLSENVEAQYFNDGRYRVYNTLTGQYTTDRINWLSEVAGNDSLVVYAQPNKRGYINVKNGEIVIDAEKNDYSRAWVFSEGLAAVEKDGKIGFINAANEVVIPFEFDYSGSCRMCDFGYVFHNGYCAMTNADGDLGLIDRSGKWVVEPMYDEIWTPHVYGYRVVVNNGKYGVLDANGAILYPVEYRYISIVSDGFILSKGGKQWQVDFEGRITCSFMFDDSSYLYYPVGEGEDGEERSLLADYMKYHIMGRYGIMNRLTGEPITLAIFSEINMLSEGLFEVQRHDIYEWYLLDVNGNMVAR